MAAWVSSALKGGYIGQRASFTPFLECVVASQEGDVEPLAHLVLFRADLWLFL